MSANAPHVIRIALTSIAVLGALAGCAGRGEVTTPEASSAPSLHAMAAPAGSGATYTYTFTNKCSLPIWIGQSADISNGTSHPPVGGSWAVAPTCTSDSQCGSGQSCANGRCSCSSAADCPGNATCASGACSTTAVFNIPQGWKSGTFWPRTECTVPSGGKLNCLTGQCTKAGDTDGLLDCGVGITSPTNPVTQFEVTSTTQTINYDVSIAAGYNVQLTAKPIGGHFVVAGLPAGQNSVPCFEAGCTADLNVTCPDDLQLQVPDGTQVRVIGCFDPCTRCQRPGPPAGLSCTAQITTDADGNSPAATTLCNGQPGGLPTFQDMYCAQNFADSTTNTQASGNQGTPTSFGQADCFPGTTFVQPAFNNYSLPSGQGVCLFVDPPQSGIPGFNDYRWHDFQSQKDLDCGKLPDGTPCGGYLTTAEFYADAMGYTCQTANFADSSNQQLTAHLCMPPTTSGLGACQKNNQGAKPLYRGVGGVTNPSWLTAGFEAGGVAAPYFETFKAACTSAYTWQYDDQQSGLGCDVPALTGGKPFSGFEVTFCK